MKNCTRLTRADRIRIARTIHGAPANQIPPRLLAFGQPPFPLMDKRDVAPMFPRLRIPAWMLELARRNASKAKAESVYQTVEAVAWAILLLLFGALIANIEWLKFALGL